MVGQSQAIIQAVSVTKIFRDFWHREKVTSVNSLDLEIFPHEVFGLLGPNGSGKSTTIKMILGLLYPSKGYIRVFDRPPTDVGVKARIGFLPEESYLYPFLNAWETLDYYGRLFRQPRQERRKRIEMLLDMVGLTAVASRRVGEYSKGMQRRIGLAQALINDPDLLILDEPTSGMDPLGTRQFKDLIGELGRRGKTVLLSSHLLADVEDVCDRVAILYGGRKRALGSIDELLSQHGLTQITTEHLGEATIQKIRRLIAEDSKTVLDVTAPRDKLETLFLRIVEQAQAERLTTGGAVGTGQVAEFLRAEPDGQAFIEQLVSANRPVEPVNSAEALVPASQPAPAVERAVLESLTKPAKPEPDRVKGDPSGSAAPASTRKAAEQADRSLIDSLVAKNEPQPKKKD